MIVDREVKKLIPLFFIQEEIARHPAARVKEIGINRYLYSSKKTWAGYLPEAEKIVFDPSVGRSIITESVNRRFPDLALKEEEAWYFFFWHEIEHANPACGPDEWAADQYAVRRILELRKGREVEERRFVSFIEDLVKEGIWRSLVEI